MFLWGDVRNVGFTTQGNAVAVKVLDVPAGWTVTRTGTVNAGTFTVTAPNADTDALEAFVFVSDAAGNTVMRTLELTCLVVPATLCTQCCYNGSAWVDCYVTTNAVSSSAQWSGNGTTYYSGASSDKDGRANTAAITGSTGTSAVQLCKNLGTGWYLPAYEELYAMSSGEANTASNNRAGAGILKDNWHWSSTEYTNNGGRVSGSDQLHAVQVWPNVPLIIRNYYKNNYFSVRCAWRK
jgi:hypothetical protein